MATYQRVWSSLKTQQDNRSDKAGVQSALTKAVKQVPDETLS